MKTTNFIPNLHEFTRIAACFAVASLIATQGTARADIFSDHVDIIVDDVSAGEPGVAAVEQVPVLADDLELEHKGPGGFDVDITPGPDHETFFITVVHWAPIDGFPVGAFDWKIQDIQWRDADGSVLPGEITGIGLPDGNVNIIPTTGLAFTHDSITISTGGFGSLSGGAFADYIVTATHTLLGDVNGDGMVNLLDVEPFIDLLEVGFYQPEADVNQDGVVNLLDVDPFIDLIAGI